jgi:hypothetical protein
MNRIFQDVQDGALSALLRSILKNPVHPVRIYYGGLQMLVGYGTGSVSDLSVDHVTT